MYKLPPGENGKERVLPESAGFRIRSRKRNPDRLKKEKVRDFGAFDSRSDVRQTEVRLRRHMQVEQYRTNKKLKNINYWEDVCRIG